MTAPVIPIPEPELVTSITTRSGFTYKVIQGSLELVEGGKVARFRTMGRSFHSPAVIHMFRDEIAIAAAAERQ